MLQALQQDTPALFAGELARVRPLEVFERLPRHLVVEPHADLLFGDHFLRDRHEAFNFPLVVLEPFWIILVSGKFFLKLHLTKPNFG